jgi:hypothetical protein
LAHHREHPAVRHALWALCAAVVGLYILLAALGVIEPWDALELTVAVFVLAALLLAHEWREQFRRERR